MHKQTFHLLSKQRLRLPCATILFLGSSGQRAFAQSEDVVRNAYVEFYFGFETALGEMSVLLLIWNLGLLLGLRRYDNPLRFFPVLASGMFLGGAIGAMAVLGPFMSTYVMVLVIGSIVATSPDQNAITAQAIVGLSGFSMLNGLLSGYPWQWIPSLAYAGIGITLVLCIFLVFSLVRSSLILLPYPWTVIAWRVTTSWTIAIAVMMIALRFASHPSGMENWFDDWTRS